MAHQVMWAKCNVFDAEGNPTIYRRGDFLPDSVDAEQLGMLNTVGATQVIADAPEEAPRAPETPGDGTEPDGLMKPANDDPKSVWVDYASDDRNPRRINRTEANAMSKAALMEMFKD